MFLYETHCHTAPVSKCGKASAEDTVRFYKKMGYDGVFITNHYLAQRDLLLIQNPLLELADSLNSFG